MNSNMNADRVVLLYGHVPPDAPEDEKDVLVEVEAVEQGLRQAGFDPVRLPITLDLGKASEELRKIRPTVVFNLVESVQGNGKLISFAPILLQSLGIPFTGCGSNAIYLTSNKILTKKILAWSGIATPAWEPVEDLIQSRAELRPPFLVKHMWEHASVGITKQSSISDAATLPNAIDSLASFKTYDLFAEKYIEGREFNISLLASPDGPEILPAAEIQFVDFPKEMPKIVDYEAKWDSNSFQFNHTPRNFDFGADDNELLEHINQICRRCWDVFELRGYARVDFRVDQNNKPWVLEVNANPCISPDAGFAAAAERSGLSYRQMVERILFEAKRW